VITTGQGYSATYGANGNMLTRIEALAGGRYTYTQTWDAENRLATITAGGVITTYTYNGDGQRIKVASGGSATVYVGSTYEVITGTGAVTTYYYLGAQRVAMRTSAGVTYLAGDHLGSASLAMGASNTSQRYYPYGGTRSGGVPTDYQFTGQKNDGGTGLYYYGARYYDPVTGRFVSADTVVPAPGAPQALNRYAYTYNNPMRYRDPSGHDPLVPNFAQMVVRGLVAFVNFETYVKPLFYNPQVGVPVAIAAWREAQGGHCPEALSLTLDWYYGRGSERRSFSEGSEVTQFLQTDRGVEAARAAFMSSGYQDATADHPFRYNFGLSEFLTEAAQAAFKDEWSGSFLGGYDVLITKVGPNKVQVVVVNDTGWRSATRIPFTPVSLRRNEERKKGGPGGTLWQYYIWVEDMDMPQTDPPMGSIVE
jgi:RHS repeat-associated protein